eukprot:CAMPEP_0172558324 /NCGR_PEP_ID=MMETSP1067-20121228/78541_1 /TAXON_ID=265564 ORGANISM="Thalassiosira punctigera, Strain Tpunct2005C2" /NCGR_SAMPLE_ID=MMETSP1067 /ASSEMBLY_ACC=CAM_ASM_000444 /LENGTH=430 /DNA_ID=CAMNT_0013347657 /DNA_START=62 /DNA_END=1355 /DNA_ORIENTATION=-
MSFQQKKRAMTPKGQMSGNGSGPAIMMMPPHIREAFMANPPLKHLPPFKRHVLVSENYVTDDDDLSGSDAKSNKAGPHSGISSIPTSFPRRKRGAGISGVSSFLHHFERTAPPARKINPTPKTIKEDKAKAKKAENDAKLAPLIEAYRAEQRGCGGEHPNGMNCYNTLFVGRLAYEVTERKMLREMEAYGPVKDLKLVTDKETGRSRGYAFVEYEHEEDMKRAYRAADGMRLEGRSIVVDVERGHTVPNWLPRKFGGGLGGTRLGGKDKNIFMAGRFDPKQVPPPNAMGPGPGMGMGPGPGGMNGGPPPGYGMGGGGGRDRGPPMEGGGGDLLPPGTGTTVTAEAPRLGTAIAEEGDIAAAGVTATGIGDLPRGTMAAAGMTIAGGDMEAALLLWRGKGEVVAVGMEEIGTGRGGDRAVAAPTGGGAGID